MRKIVRDSAAVVVLAGAAIVGISGVASATTSIHPANAVPKTGGPGPNCTGFDSTQSGSIVWYDPDGDGNPTAVVGGPYIATLNYCLHG